MQDTVRQNIATYGQHVWQVLPNADDPPDTPPFVYTVGNHEHGLPELLLIGTAETWAVDLINELGERQRARGVGFLHDELVGLGGTFPVKLVEVGSIAREDYTIQVGCYYATEDYSVRQVLLCDRAGHFPGDPECAPPFRWQPILSRHH